LDPVFVGVICFVALLVFIALGFPIGIAMAVPGLLGLFYLVGFEGALGLYANTVFSYATKYDLAALPLFLIMGYISVQAGLTRSAYDSARVWLYKLPGGLAMATAVASGLLGACMGTGLPAAAALSRIAIPEMLRHNYDKGLSAGSVAAAATVAVLIPPSILMVIYASFTEVSLGRMLMAGYLPGILSVAIFMVMIGIRCRLNPSLAPSNITETITWKNRFIALKGIWGIGVLLIVLVGGIYSGFFTATEAAGVVAFIAFVLMFVQRKFTWHGIREAFSQTLEVSAMVFLIFAGAISVMLVMAISGTPKALTSLLLSANLGINWFLIMLFVLYIILGCFMDSITILLLTLPVVLPVLNEFDVNLIWFGILCIKIVEIGGITPPFGISVYVVKAVVRDEIPTGVIFKGIGWFVVMEILTVVILFAFPQISLWLPDLLRGT
jgi:tripartite ATP-independent transporter DctM subunit